MMSDEHGPVGSTSVTEPHEPQEKVISPPRAKPVHQFPRRTTKLQDSHLVAGIRWMATDHPHLYKLWMAGELPPLLKEAIRTIGIKEYPGEASNPEIDLMLREIADVPGGVENDNAEWCASMLAIWARRCGMPIPKYAKWSQAWKAWGDDAMASPQLGDVAVFTRGDPTQQKGHVGVIAAISAEGGGWFSVVGGNTSDAVDDSWRRRDGRLVAVRRPPLAVFTAP